MTNLHIKNMVCNRCIMVVENELKRLNIPYLDVHLGEVNINNELSKESRELVRIELQKYGSGSFGR
jgi:copper chaperone CopZ